MPKTKDDHQLKARILERFNPWRIKQPVQHTPNKVTEYDVLQIRELYAQGATQAVLAERFEICQEAVGKIVRGDTWKDVGGPRKPNRTRGGRGRRIPKPVEVSHG